MELMSRTQKVHWVLLYSLGLDGVRYNNLSLLWLGPRPWTLPERTVVAGPWVFRGLFPIVFIA